MMLAAAALDPEAIYTDWRRRLGVGPLETRQAGDWKPWSEPRPALPIDEQISRLIGQRIIRPEIVGDLCAYARARRGLFYAGLRAMQADDDAAERKLDVERLGAVKRNLSKLGAEIKRSARLLSGLQDPSAIEGRGEGAAIHDLLTALLHSQVLLERGRPVIEERHLDLSQNWGNAGRIAFAETMGGCWSFLTGRAPSVSDALEDFLSAGWATLFPQSDVVNWTSAIRTAAARLRA